jgi:hypothetical protein
VVVVVVVVAAAKNPDLAVVVDEVGDLLGDPGRDRPAVSLHISAEVFPQERVQDPADDDADPGDAGGHPPRVHFRPCLGWLDRLVPVQYVEVGLDLLFGRRMRLSGF